MTSEERVNYLPDKEPEPKDEPVTTSTTKTENKDSEELSSVDGTEEERKLIEVPCSEEEQEPTCKDKYSVINHKENTCKEAAFPLSTDCSEGEEQENSQSTVPDTFEEETEEKKPNYTSGDFLSDGASDSSSEEKCEEGSEMGSTIAKSCLNGDSGDEGADNSRSRKKEPKMRQMRMDAYMGKKGEDHGKGEKMDVEGAPKKLRKRYSDMDTEMYRTGYPGKKDDPKLDANLRFYRNEIESTPEGAKIDDIHSDWWGNYKLLERHHGYIQWLFPIREDGMNWQAQALQKHEAEAIMKDKNAHKRVLKSYKMMLDFYGMTLVDPETGRLKRSENWEDCFANLNWSSHNYLRITRMLKCLGELGYEHLKKGFIKFVLKEALTEKTLPRTVTSCRDYWIGTIKNDSDRDELHQFIEAHRHR